MGLGSDGAGVSGREFIALGLSSGTVVDKGRAAGGHLGRHFDRVCDGAERSVMEELG